MTTIEDLRRLKKEAGLTNAEIAELSSIPFSTVNKIFSGATENPRYGTLLAIEHVLMKKEKMPFRYDELLQEPCLIQEEAAMYGYDTRRYDSVDIDKLDEWTRAELIDGKLYLMATPNRKHQYLSSQLSFALHLHIQSKKGKCHVYAAPTEVRLFEDDRTYVIPDLFVVCRREIMTDRGCMGAPDMMFEIISPSNSSYDYITKLMKYQKAGVREYWIVDPEQEKVTVMNFEKPQFTGEYTFSEVATSGVLEGFSVKIAELLEEY